MTSAATEKVALTDAVAELRVALDEPSKQSKRSSPRRTATGSRRRLDGRS
jgi:hypothetical protein